MNQKFLFVAVTHGYEQKNPVCDKNLAENHEIFEIFTKYLMIFSQILATNRNFLFVAVSHGYEQEFLVRSRESWLPTKNPKYAKHEFGTT